MLTTGKMQTLSLQIKKEQSINEKMKKLHANELLQQSAESKRMSLEITKLKVQNWCIEWVGGHPYLPHAQQITTYISTHSLRLKATTSTLWKQEIT